MMETNMKKTAMLLAIGIMAMLPLAAQIDLPRPSLNPWQTGTKSPLLDASRISMSHSMGFMAGSSSAGYGYYLSNYTNHLKYELSPKLDLALDLNFVNYGSTSGGFKFNSDNQSKVIPEFKLNYRPSESFRVSVEFKRGYPWLGSDSAWLER